MRGVCCLLVLLAAPALVVAAADNGHEPKKAEPVAHPLAGHDAAGHGDAHGDGHGAEKGGDNIFRGLLDLTIWTIVVFLVLFAILGNFAWKPLLGALKSREDTIHGALAAAEKARSDAESYRAQHKAELDKAQDTVRTMIEQARKDATRNADELLTKTRAEIQTERDRLRREIDNAKDQALQDIWGQTAELATLVSARAIRRELTADDHRRLVDDALQEIRQAGDDWRQQAVRVKL